MNRNRNEASRWRIEFAEELSRVYSAEKTVKMIVLGGSPSRGLSDEYSDIDMVVYWDEMNKPFIESAPLKPYGGDLRLAMRDPDGSIGMELYYFDTLIFEVGHIAMKDWNEIVSLVIDKHDLNPHNVKTIGGFFDAVPIYGEDAYHAARKKIEHFPRELAVQMVSKNLGFFWRDCILNQGIKRGEIVFYHDAFCMTIKRLMAVLAGLNHRYFSPIEPRWIEYELNRMSIKPDDAWPRIKSIFEKAPKRGMQILNELINEVVGLVKKHMPEADLTRFEQNNALEVRATYSKPKLNP